MQNAPRETVTDSRGILRTAREILKIPDACGGDYAKAREIGIAGKPARGVSFAVVPYFEEKGAPMKYLLYTAILVLSVGSCLKAEEEFPGVPALRVADGKKSFVVESYIVGKEQHGLAMRVATDGQKHLFLIMDAANHVPMFISNGEETLIYDLAQDQITLVPKSCFGFHLQYDPEKSTFNFGLSCKASKNANEREECLPKIEFDR